MNTRFSITLDKKDKDRLERLALGYGLALPALARRVLETLKSELPTESFDDYEHPVALRASFNKALQNFKHGRVSTRL
jgi:hypothetical protein